MKKLFCCIFILAGASLLAQTTIETQLLVTTNEGTNGGSFRVAIQAKGTSLLANNTLGSATIDVYYAAADIQPIIIALNNVQVTYNAAITSSAYTRSATYVAGGPYIRLTLSGANVNSNFDGTPAGFDLTSSYQTLATINFTILNSAVSTDLTIGTGSLTVGLFSTHNNEDFSGTIIPQTMSAPVNIVNEPLPVELTSFTSKYLNDKIHLSWITKTEVNNSGFNVERKINESEWMKIGFVEGNGNSNSPKEYRFTDNDLSSGGSKFFYRLKQIDNDGQFEYSDVIEVNISPQQYELLQNYPNPFNPYTVIQFSTPTAGYVNLVVFNILGEQVAELVNGFKESGVYKINFDASELNSGVYFYKLSTGNFSEVKKLMVIK